MYLTIPGETGPWPFNSTILAGASRLFPPEAMDGDGVLSVGDQPALVAAQAAERFGLAFSPPGAVRAANNKFLSRERFAAAGLLMPGYRLVTQLIDSQSIRYPCVLKPLGLSGSRGVIRADNATEFAAAFARIQKLMERDRAIEHDRSIQVEEFIPGREFALEGVVTRGELQTLALFDKPDLLDGPFFEETIYVTPSRMPEEVRRAIHETTQYAIHALGLTSGPVHAEMRVNDRGVWMLEVAARPIGGLCSRVLRFDFAQEGADHERALAPVARQDQALHTVGPQDHALHTVAPLLAVARRGR